MVSFYFSPSKITNSSEVGKLIFARLSEAFTARIVGDDFYTTCRFFYEKTGETKLVTSLYKYVSIVDLRNGQSRFLYVQFTDDEITQTLEPDKASSQLQLGWQV